MQSLSLFRIRKFVGHPDRIRYSEVRVRIRILFFRKGMLAKFNFNHETQFQSFTAFQFHFLKYFLFERKSIKDDLRLKKGLRSVSQRYGSAYPDPFQNVRDPRSRWMGPCNVGRTRIHGLLPVLSPGTRPPSPARQLHSLSRHTA